MKISPWKWWVELSLALGLGIPWADGVIEIPPARNWYCGALTKPDQVDAGTAQYPTCGKAFSAIPMAGYNFMSVVTHTQGRAHTTPLPKHVCSFDSETWKGAQTPWDVPMEWPTSPLSSGENTFTWNGSWGAHFDDTKEFSFWITKPNFVFDPTRELTWEDFEDSSFCTEGYDDKNPAGNSQIQVDKTHLTFTIHCQVPSRVGHQVIYAEWGRDPSTWQRFHGCIDVAMNSVLKSESWKKMGKAKRKPYPLVLPNALGRKRHS